MSERRTTHNARVMPKEGERRHLAAICVALVFALMVTGMGAIVPDLWHIDGWWVMACRLAFVVLVLVMSALVESMWELMQHE